jgi:hypothetical protein
MFGIGLLGLITFLIVAGVGGQQRAAQRLADTRAATRLAEDALVALRAGAAAPAKEEVQLTRLADAAPEGFVWVRSAARSGMAQVQVLGLIPARTVPAPEGAKP